MTFTTLYISRPTVLSIVTNGVSSDTLVHFISLTSDIQTSVAYLTPYSEPTAYTTIFFECNVLNSSYSFLAEFNWQANDQTWRGVNPILVKNTTYSIANLNLQSIISNIVVVLETISASTVVNNAQRRVIYVGYWLNNADIPSLIEAWKAANITHILLVFITQENYTQEISDIYSMTQAFFGLTTKNQDDLLDNFVVGVSYGGAAAMPVPYSNTFDLPDSKYRPTSQGGKGAEGLAADLIKLCGTKLANYYDLDIEGISQIPDNSPTTEFLGALCQALKAQNPTCVISHAPQTPYFDPSFGSVYVNLYTTYGKYFDWYNIQYYNNGSSNTYNEIFVNSDTTSWPGVAVLQLIQDKGIAPSYIVVGKPVNASEGNAGGFVPLPTLATYFSQAFTDIQLQSWAKSTGGSMIYYYNSQAQSGAGNTFLNDYVKTVFNPQPAATATVDNQSLLDFMYTISQL